MVSFSIKAMFILGVSWTIRRTSEHTFPGYQSAFLQHISTSSYGSQRDLQVSTTMGILSLCADSARPPGMTTHPLGTNGSGDMPGTRSCAQRPCLQQKPLYPIHDDNYNSTTYYTKPILPSLLTPLFPRSRLHVISIVTPLIFCWHLCLLLCLTLVTVMLSQMRRQRASKSINTTTCDQTDDPAKPADDTIFANDTLSNAKPKHAQEAIIAAEIKAFWTEHQIKKVLHPMRICQTEDHPEDCFIAADSAYWTDYWTEAPFDTDPTLRIGNQDWQADLTAGSPMAHTDTDDASVSDWYPDYGFWMDDTHYDHDGYRVDDEHAYDAIRKEYHSLLRPSNGRYYTQDDQKHALTLKDYYTSQPESTYGQETNAKLTAVTIPNGHFTQRHIYPRPSQQNQEFNRPRPCTLPADAPSRKSPQHSKMKVSHTSNDKWRTQARQFLTNWTPRHMDAYLAIPVTPSCAKSLYAAWGGGGMVHRISP